MTRGQLAAARMGAMLAVVGLGASCGTASGPTSTTQDIAPPTATATSPPMAPSTTSPAKVGPLADGAAYRSVVPMGCSITGSGPWVLPDHRCTPGALNPAVTPATIATTICVSGYSTRIRPPQSFTYRLKRAQMAAWSIVGATSQVEEDHLVPLSLGGAPSDSANLWPEPGGIPNPKDQLEYRLYRMVCDHTLGLRTAQTAISGNWIDAYRRYVGPPTGP